MTKCQWYCQLAFNLPQISTVYKYGFAMCTACFPCNQADSWQQLKYHTLLATCSPLSGHEKTKEITNDLKIAILKRQQGSKVKSMQTSQGSKIWKQLKIQLKGCYRMEMNSKTFAIPILTAILSTINQNRDSNCYRIYFHSIQQTLGYIFKVFHYSLFPNLFAQFFAFNSYSFLKLQIFKSFN